MRKLKVGDKVRVVPTSEMRFGYNPHMEKVRGKTCTIKIAEVSWFSSDIRYNLEEDPGQYMYGDDVLTYMANKNVIGGKIL